MMLDWLGRRHSNDAARRGAALIDAASCDGNGDGVLTPELGGTATQRKWAMRWPRSWRAGRGHPMSSEVLLAAEEACRMSGDGLLITAAPPASPGHRADPVVKLHRSSH